MTAREWKPGDVAMATVRGVPNVQIVRTGSSRNLWFSPESHGPYADGVDSIKWHEAPKHVADARPLIVIDPEDREQVKRLAEELYVVGFEFSSPVDPLPTVTEGYKAGYADRVAEALSALANPTPPKPEEPTGLGAVVEDAEGRKFVRQCTGSDEQDMSHPWLLLATTRDAMPAAKVQADYRELRGVTVLSEGVTQ